MTVRWEAEKDPDDVADFALNWSASPRLGNDEIVASDWIGVHEDLTVESDSFTVATTTVWLSGGVAGTTYELTNRVTTAGGRTLDQTALLVVKHQ